ncbi:DUF4760 domain-containing protein [Bizionia sp. M204]|uniref:DUF4760 domain-containing protein n=1 Tax=Bizionia sp. M204 TaxID=2675331 RepID=UPI00205F77C3|nr:DUF4760 domain-containing protein [Bizionia sp. M204]UPS92827.1 DUF4760 domain-containing protein [Bizionia sp. M204]
MKHEISLNYKIKYVWIGLICIVVFGVLLFLTLAYHDIKITLIDVITYLAGMCATLTLLYHAFSLEYQILAQKENTDLLRTKYTYDMISKWSSTDMRECVNEVRSILKDSDRLKELQDPSQIEKFAEYLKSNSKHRGYLVQTLNYFENIATMYDTNHIDHEIVKKTFKSLFISYYAVLKNYIDFRQKEYPDSWYYYEKVCKVWIENNKTA